MNIVMKKRLSRRTILRGFGATLALPLLDGMLPAFASPYSTVRHWLASLDALEKLSPSASIVRTEVKHLARSLVESGVWRGVTLAQAELALAGAEG